MGYRRPFNQDEVIAVSRKCNGCCKKCGNKEDLCIHHVIPLKKGGSNDVSNLIILCKFCHKFVHKNKNEIEYYDETKYYSSFGKESIKSEYYQQEHNWKLSTDSTDHFDFICPRCECTAIIDKVELRDYGPCFYFYLKCNKCKVNGQRKAYVNSDYMNWGGN